MIDRQMADGMCEECRGAAWSLLLRHGTPAIRWGSDLLIGQVIVRRGGIGSPPADGRSIARAGRLVAESWGSYLAVLVDGPQIAVMPDPSGGLPAWVAEADGLTMVSDDISPALYRVIGKPIIDRAAVAAGLVEPASATHLSFVRGVTPLVPGEIRDLATGQRVSVWRPDHHARSHERDSPERLRNAVESAATALFEPGAMLQLSGGLDSSILATTLAAHGHRPLAINFATADAAGDERGFAGMAAEQAGLELVSTVLNRLPDYRRIAAAPQRTTPYVFGLDDAVEDAVDAVGTERSATSIITGQGGDAVFFQPATTLTSADCARASGLGRAFQHWLPDAARRTRTSIWPHLAAVAADRLGWTRVPARLLGAGLLTEDARAQAVASDRRHPWVRGIKPLPPGKRMQIVMLANSQIFHAARATGKLPQRHPLLTQPVLEAALAIPTFELARGRRDRGLARELFADRLPAAIVARTTKGEATNHYSQAALANLPFLREFLLDGQLAGMGVLDRAALDALLTREALFYSLDYQALTMQVSCEAWARAWAG